MADPVDPQTIERARQRQLREQATEQSVRMRILPITEAPDGAFLIVFDRVPLSRTVTYALLATEMKAKTGAVGIMVCPDELDVPQAFRGRAV